MQIIIMYIIFISIQICKSFVDHTLLQICGENNQINMCDTIKQRVYLTIFRLSSYLTDEFNYASHLLDKDFMKARKHAASNAYKCTTKLMNMKYKTAFATFSSFSSIFSTLSSCSVLNKLI